MVDRTLEQLQQRLAELETEWNEVETAIAAKLEEDKKELAEEIVQRIHSAGHDLADVVNLIVSRKRRGKAATKSSYTTYVDPENPKNTYVRGVLPRWLKDKMQAAGFNPAKKEDRESYKLKHLKAVND